MLYWHDWAQKLHFFLNFRNLVFHFVALSRFKFYWRKSLLKYILRLNIYIYKILFISILKVFSRNIKFNLSLYILFLYKIFLYFILALIIFKLIHLIKSFDWFIFGKLKLFFLFKNMFIRLHSIIILFW